MRQIPLTRARTVLGRLARKDGLARGEVVEVTRRGRAVLAVQRANDYTRPRRRDRRSPRRLRGSLSITGDLEAASRVINARLRRAAGGRRAS